MWIEPGACRLADVVPAMVDMTTDSPDHHVHVDHTPLSISQWSSIVDSVKTLPSGLLDQMSQASKRRANDRCRRERYRRATATKIKRGTVTQI
jgi:hypothetical protein